MKIIPFGTNGFFPSYSRQTACYVIPYGKILIILDAGSGLFRFAEPIGIKLLAKVREIHVFLSHYHLDHTFGFYSAFALFRGKKVTVFGSHEGGVFSEFITQENFTEKYSKKNKNFIFKTLSEDVIRIMDYEVFVRRQFHRGVGSLAYRFAFSGNKTVAYVTDSEPNAESIEFVRDADLLLHEHDFENEKSKYVKGTKLEKLFNGAHVTTAGAAVTANRAKVKKLYLIHHNPFANDESLNRELKASKSIFKESFLAKDLEAINF